MSNDGGPRFLGSSLFGAIVGAIIGGVIPGGLLLWHQYLAPFQPSATPGTVGIKIQNVPFPLLAVVVPLTFENNGAQPGCFYDVALEVDAEISKTKWDLFPVWYLDYASFLRERSKELKKDISNFTESTFLPVSIGGRQQLSKTIVFMSRPPAMLGGHQFSADVLTPNEKYRFRFMFARGAADCNIGSEARYDLLAERSFKISEGQLASLGGGDLVNLLDETRDRLRENLIKE